MQNKFDQLLETLQDYARICKEDNYAMQLFFPPGYKHIDRHSYCRDSNMYYLYEDAYYFITCVRAYHEAWQNGQDLKPIIDKYLDIIQDLKYYSSIDSEANHDVD